jgi:hypothetical protein
VLAQATDPFGGSPMAGALGEPYLSQALRRWRSGARW